MTGEELFDLDEGTRVVAGGIVLTRRPAAEPGDCEFVDNEGRLYDADDIAEQGAEVLH